MAVHVSPRTSREERKRRQEALRDRACRMVSPHLFSSQGRYSEHAVSRAFCSGGGSVGRRLAAHGRHSDLELLSHGVGTFVP